MEMVCLMKEVAPKVTADPNGQGSIVDYWNPSKKMMSKTKFLESLMEYDKDNISPLVVEKIRPHMDDPNFEPEVVAKSSAAATGCASGCAR